MKTLILASRSPRRRSLLSEAGFNFITLDADIDESVQDGEDPESYVKRMAREKAQAAPWGAKDETVLLTADTTVALAGEILGKPGNAEEARAMLFRLSGNTHLVFTAVCICAGAEKECFSVVSEVRFRDLSEREVEEYVSSGEPFDKAGGYGIQGAGGKFVAEIRGSISNVVGLPLDEVSRVLIRFGVARRDS